MAKALIKTYNNPNRPRVKKWAMCPKCGEYTPLYLCEVDHVIPVVPIDSKLEDMTWDEVVNRTWCVVENLQILCIKCHKDKSKGEMKQRRKNKNER